MRTDLENNAACLFCKIHPNSKVNVWLMCSSDHPITRLTSKKNSQSPFTSPAKHTLHLLLVCEEDCNHPNIHWETGTAINNDSIYSYFTKLVRDNYLWQLVDSPTLNANILDLALIENNINASLSNWLSDFVGWFWPRAKVSNQKHLLSSLVWLRGIVASDKEEESTKKEGSLYWQTRGLDEIQRSPPSDQEPNVSKEERLSTPARR